MWEYLCVFEMCVGVSQHVCVFVAWNAAFLRGSAAESPSSAYSTASLQSIKSGMHQRAHAHAHTHTHTPSAICSAPELSIHLTHTHQTESPGRKAMKSYYFYTHKTHAVLSADSCFFSFSPLYGLKHFANANTNCTFTRVCTYLKL